MDTIDAALEHVLNHAPASSPASASERTGVLMRLRNRTSSDARILIVDDRRPTCACLERLRVRPGYTALTSTWTRSRCAHCTARNDYDLILLDLQLPVMDGFQVMTALQAGRPTVTCR